MAQIVETCSLEIMEHSAGYQFVVNGKSFQLSPKQHVKTFVENVLKNVEKNVEETDPVIEVVGTPGGVETMFQRPRDGDGGENKGDDKKDKDEDEDRDDSGSGGNDSDNLDSEAEEESKPIQVFVNCVNVGTFSGTIVDFYVIPEITVKAMKHMVWSKLQIKPSYQRLLFNEIPLENARSLKSYNIIDDSIMTLMVAGVGGGKRSRTSGKDSGKIKAKIDTASQILNEQIETLKGKTPSCAEEESLRNTFNDFIQADGNNVSAATIINEIIKRCPKSNLEKILGYVDDNPLRNIGQIGWDLMSVVSAPAESKMEDLQLLKDSLCNVFTIKFLECYGTSGEKIDWMSFKKAIELRLLVLAEATVGLDLRTSSFSGGEACFFKW
jgi:hypothetical protein